MMNVTKHRKLLVGIGAALLCLIALTAVRCTAVHAPQPEPPQEAEEREEQDGGGQEEPDGLALLSDADRAKIAAYDGDTLDFIALLETNKWVDAAETSTLAFGQNAFTVTRSDGSATQPLAFAVRAIDAEVLANGDGAVPVKAYTASVSSAKGDYLMRVDQSSDGAWRVSSALFNSPSKATYYMVAGESSLSLEVDEKALDEATGGRAAELAARLKVYCANLYPTARTATWTGEATTDYAKRTVAIAFVLDNRAASRVEVVFDEQAGAFAFGNTKSAASAAAEEPAGKESEARNAEQ